MDQMPTILRHVAECVDTGEKLRALFELPPPKTEKIVAHAFFCRCVDHFQAAVLLAQADHDIEALALGRGIAETTFVIGALLTGTISTRELEAFDLAGRAKSARAQSDFLRRNAEEAVQKKVQAFAEAHSGPVLKFEKLAKAIDAEDLYNGQYRMFSHAATHPTMSSVEKYLDYGPDQTDVRYPGVGRPRRTVMLLCSTLFVHTCSSVEHWMQTSTPEINRSINDRLNELASFGPVIGPD